MISDWSEGFLTEVPINTFYIRNVYLYLRIILAFLVKIPTVKTRVFRNVTQGLETGLIIWDDHGKEKWT